MVLRFMDGSIDMLDQFMTAPGCATIQSSDTGNADAQKSCLPLHQSETPSSPQHTVCETHSADNVSPALVQQHQGMQSRDVLHQNAAAGQHQNDEVAVLHMDNLSYQQFVENFMQPNLPVMIQVQGSPDPWHTLLSWCKARLYHAEFQPYSKFLVHAKSLILSDHVKPDQRDQYLRQPYAVCFICTACGGLLLNTYYFVALLLASTCDK